MNDNKEKKQNDFDEQLKLLLKQRREVETKIENLFKNKFGGVTRFSSKKFVGDLGEYYFLKEVSIFKELKQSVTSNFACDLVGKLLSNYEELFDLGVENIRIEVKTRHAQRGNNHLFGIKPQNFDLLSFVALSDDYSCRHIGIIKSSDIKVDKQNRIKYSDYYKKHLVKWKTNDWIELK